MRLGWALLLFTTVLHAQRGTGELRLSVLDDSGAGVEASGTLLSQAIQLRLTFTTDDQGRYVIPDLP